MKTAKGDVSKHPVAKAVAPLKADAICRAEEEAKEIVERFKVDFAEAGCDGDVYAPRPKNPWDRSCEYRRQILTLLTRSVESVRMRNDPDIRVVADDLVARYVDTAKKSAAEQYDLFVMKLVRKIGDVKNASIEGNHVWGHSVLTVTRKGGETEKWKTKQILNVSKLGLLFNQWPTRKLK